MAGVLLPGPATVRSIRLLVATQASGYLTLAFLLLAALAGGPRAWLATALAFAATLIVLVLTTRARRAAPGPEVGPDYEAEGWRPPWAQAPAEHKRGLPRTEAGSGSVKSRLTRRT